MKALKRAVFSIGLSDSKVGKIALVSFSLTKSLRPCITAKDSFVIACSHSSVVCSKFAWEQEFGMALIFPQDSISLGLSVAD